MELLEAPQFAGGEMLPGPRLFQIRQGGVALGLGRRSGAGVEQGGRERVNDGQHRLAGRALQRRL